jgi:hypothetical protein
MRRLLSTGALVAVALAGFGLPSPARADGLLLSLSGPEEWFITPVPDQTVVLGAGRRASISATAMLNADEHPCHRGDFSSQAPFSATLLVPPGVTLLESGAATRTLAMPSSLPNFDGLPYVVFPAWPLSIAQPGSFSVGVSASATTTSGRLCTGDQRGFTLAAISGGPTFRVLGAVLHRKSGVVDVTFRMTLPGLHGASHDTYEAAATGLDELKLQVPGRRHLMRPFMADGIGDDGIGCDSFNWPGGRAATRVRYRITYAGDRDLALRAQHRRGSTRLAQSARGRRRFSC